VGIRITGVNSLNHADIGSLSAFRR